MTKASKLFWGVFVPHFFIALLWTLVPEPIPQISVYHFGLELIGRIWSIAMRRNFNCLWRWQQTFHGNLTLLLTVRIIQKIFLIVPSYHFKPELKWISHCISWYHVLSIVFIWLHLEFINRPHITQFLCCIAFASWWISNCLLRQMAFHSDLIRYRIR